MKYEKLQANIPVGADFTIEDIDQKAKGLGIERTDLIIKAVDMFINFDNEFLEYIKHYADGLKIPEYLVIQNFIIGMMADKEAKDEVFGPVGEILEEFIQVLDDKGPRTLTGAELKKQLKMLRVRKYKKELEEIEQRRKLIESKL